MDELNELLMDVKYSTEAHLAMKTIKEKFKSLTEENAALRVALKSIRDDFDASEKSSLQMREIARQAILNGDSK